jgi:signal transduction histidine kinase
VPYAFSLTRRAPAANGSGLRLHNPRDLLGFLRWDRDRSQWSQRLPTSSILAAIRVELFPKWHLGELSSDFAPRFGLLDLVAALIMNTIEAMGATEASEGKLLGVSAKDGVLVTMEDSGAGLHGESLDYLFEAFFTTRARGIGTGHAVSQAILEAHGAPLWATPNSSRGATCQFTLPANNGRAA